MFTETGMPLAVNVPPMPPGVPMLFGTAMPSGVVTCAAGKTCAVAEPERIEAAITRSDKNSVCVIDFMVLIVTSKG